MSKKTKGRRRGRKKSPGRGGGAGANFMERLSFGATLVAVGAVAIFFGWLLGQYAIRSITSPTVAVGSLERPAAESGETVSTPSGAEVAGGTVSPGATETTPRRTETSPAPTPARSNEGPRPSPGGLWRVQAGAFSRRSSAEAHVDNLRAHGFEAIVSSSNAPFRVQVGAYSDEQRARAVVDDLIAEGFEAIVLAPE